jgi:hypothetical protein
MFTDISICAILIKRSKDAFFARSDRLLQNTKEKTTIPRTHRQNPVLFLMEVRCAIQGCSQSNTIDLTLSRNRTSLGKSLGFCALQENVGGKALDSKKTHWLSPVQMMSWLW